MIHVYKLLPSRLLIFGSNMNHVSGFILGNFVRIFISLVLFLSFQWDIINGETNTGENSRQREIYQRRHKRSIVIQKDDLHNFICWKYGHGSVSQEFKESSSPNENCTGPNSVASRDVSNSSRYTVCAGSNDDDILHKYYCQCDNSQGFSLTKNKCTTDYADYPSSSVVRKLYSFNIYDLMESHPSSSHRLSGSFSPDLSSECQFSGKFPLENYCDRYIQCLPGPSGTFEAYLHHCPPGKDYSKNYRLCMHPHLARCPYKGKPEIYIPSSSATASPEVTLNSSIPSITSSTPVPYEIPLETSNPKISPGGYYEDESSKPETLLTAPLSSTPNTTSETTAPLSSTTNTTSETTAPLSSTTNTTSETTAPLSSTTNTTSETTAPLSSTTNTTSETTSPLSSTTNTTSETTAPLSSTTNTTSETAAPYVNNVTMNFDNSEMSYSSSNTTNGTTSYPYTIEISATPVRSSLPFRRNRTEPFQYTEQVPPTYEDSNPELPNEHVSRESPENYNLRLNGQSQPVFPGNVTTYEDEIPSYSDPGDEIIKQLYKYYQMERPNGSDTYNKTTIIQSGGRNGPKYLFKHLSFNYTDIEPKYNPDEDMYYKNETSTEYHSDPLYENQEPPPVYNDHIPEYNPDDDPPLVPESVYSNTYEQMKPSYYREPTLYDPELEESFKAYPPSPPSPEVRNVR